MRFYLLQTNKVRWCNQLTEKQFCGPNCEPHQSFRNRKFHFLNPAILPLFIFKVSCTGPIKFGLWLPTHKWTRVMTWTESNVLWVPPIMLTQWLLVTNHRHEIVVAIYTLLKCFITYLLFVRLKEKLNHPLAGFSRGNIVIQKRWESSLRSWGPSKVTILLCPVIRSCYIFSNTSFQVFIIHTIPQLLSNKKYSTATNPKNFRCTPGWCVYKNWFGIRLKSQYVREAYAHKERKGHPQIAWNIKKNCIETLDFSISIHIIILQ